MMLENDKPGSMLFWARYLEYCPVPLVLSQLLPAGIPICPSPCKRDDAEKSIWDKFYKLDNSAGKSHRGIVWVLWWCCLTSQSRAASQCNKLLSRSPDLLTYLQKVEYFWLTASGLKTSHCAVLGVLFTVAGLVNCSSRYVLSRDVLKVNMSRRIR